MTCVEPQRMRMTRSFSHYTDGARGLPHQQFENIFIARLMVLRSVFAGRLAPTGECIRNMWELSLLAMMASRFNAK